MILSRLTAAWALAAVAGLAAASPARAHFPWLATDGEGHALLFFGEGPTERDYHTPDAVANATVLLLAGDAEPAEVAMPAVETDEFVGRKSAEALAAAGALEAEIRYGIYHGMLLDYYARHLTSADALAPKSGLKLAATPKFTDDGVELSVSWDGEPVADASVTMIDPAGVPTEAQTDESGVAKFARPDDGLIGFLYARMDRQANGEIDGEKYTSAGAYGTLTVQLGAAAATEAAVPAESAADATAALAPLPEPLSSFGAAVCDGWLYVYSGHTGEAHAHSIDNLSQHFRRLNLASDGAWEELPMETPLQGLPLVAHGGKLYRAGGLTFRNKAEDDSDMHSVAEFACFDPATGKWTALAPLPEARSSHDAVVIGDVLYVVGGWTLSGEDEGDWLDTAWSFDLTRPDGQWQAIAGPPFKRRALAVGAWNGRLVAVGGMDDEPSVTRKANAFDPATGQWTELPELPQSETAGRLAGFGVSAWNMGGQLLVSGADGVVHRLADDGSAWETAGELATGRFFHRLMPGGGSTLLAVAGASMTDGHLASIELFSPKVEKN